MSGDVRPVTPPVDDKPRTWPLVGDVNILEAFIGQRGMGKSSKQAQRALEIQRETGAYVVGHSLGRRMPEILPKELGGARLPIEYHGTLAALERGLKRDPRRWHFLAPKLPEEGGPPEPETADDLMRWSVRLSTGIRTDAYQRAHPFALRMPRQPRFTGLSAPPIVVVLDEGIAVDAASTGDSATGRNKWFLQYIYSIRHYHIALLYAIQEPTSRSWRVLESATVLYAFKLRHEWAVNAMRAAGLPPEDAEKLRHLERGEFIRFE